LLGSTTENGSLFCVNAPNAVGSSVSLHASIEASVPPSWRTYGIGGPVTLSSDAPTDGSAAFAVALNAPTMATAPKAARNLRMVYLLPADRGAPRPAAFSLHITHPHEAHLGAYDAGMQAAFFDLDKTIISRSSSLALSRPLYRAGMVSRGQLLRGAYAQLVYLLVGADEQKMERLKEGMLQLTKGWDRAQVEQLVQDTILDVIDPYVYQEALDLIALHRSEGRDIYVVSSSPEEVVRPLARHFGVAGVIATRAQVGDDGLYTGELEFYAYGAFKADAIRQLAHRAGLDLAGSYAYSDSFTDLPMLEVVGHPVAVNADRELRRVAEERGWERRDFRSPVRLRTRIASAVPAPRPSYVAGAFGVIAVAAVLGWVALRSRDRRLSD
jgi:HAD superfamily hydrolase (TIGR01490 family)